MGSSSSHLGHRPRANRSRRIISSLICGASSSREMDDHPEAELGITLGRRDLAMNESERSTKDSSMLSCTETGFRSTNEESGSTSVSRVAETRNPENYMPESNNLAHPYQTSDPVNVLAQTNGGSVESLVHNSTDGPLLSVSDQSLNAGPVEDESVHHLNLVSVSSIISPINNADIMSIREARRNSRRLFWDAFSRRNSRRHTDTTPTTVHSNDDDTDDLGSHGRWLHDFNGDFLDDGVGSDSGYLGRRLHSMNERRRHSRSEIWERIRSGLDDNGLRTAYCPSGVHPDGTCSCDSFLMTEESSTHASITRIVMLTEALFEVLDEIHRQPLTFSLSMVSLPAPESVVNSFPVKYHKTLETDDCRDDVQQCYICLGEYEDGDKIRVLPCHHEYHMSCVDKWLKEIHGVCPLCRGDVCQGINQCSSNSNLENLSLQ